MSLLSMVQTAAAMVGAAVPTSIIGNPAADAVQWLALAKREGEELKRRHDWQELIVDHTWTSTATAAQADALPSDYGRLVPDVEVWNRSNSTMLTGPVSSNAWQRLQSTAVSGGSSGWWRIVRGELNIYPTPDAGDTYALEYITENWALSATLEEQSTFEADTDTAVFDETLMELGLVWRWLRAKGMDYAEEMATYEREVEKAAARDRGLGVMVVDRGDTDITDYTWQGEIIP